MSESPATDFPDDRTKERAYLVTDFKEEEHARRRMEDQNRRTRDEWKLKKSRSAYKLDQVPMLKVIEPVNDVFRKAVDYHVYCFIKK